MMASVGDTQEFTELTPVTILNGDGEETEMKVPSSKGTNHIKQEINDNVGDDADPLGAAAGTSALLEAADHI